VPLLLPCHRVVPAAGGTGGYAFGPAVKAALLALEALQALDRDEPRGQRSVA
jgi:O6-methylguanine-DNA--protein-cysteine methyltransferase